MKNNPNWWRSIIACTMMAALIWGIFYFPFIKIWCGLMLIYVMHVLLAEKEMKAGTDKVWGWIKNLGGVFQGIIIFLLLRIFVGSLLGLPPIDSYRTLKQVGVPGFISGYNTPSILLFELAFVAVAGGLTSNYVKSKGKTIVNTTFVVSLLIFIFQNALPTYAKTWPNRETVSTNLIDHGVAGTGWKGVRIFLFGKPSPPPPTPSARITVSATQPVEALVLIHEFYTPHTNNLPAGKIKIRTDGDPVRVKFAGIRQPVDYPAKGDFVIPEGAEAGETFFASTNQMHLNVRVQVYKKVTVLQ